MKNTIKLYLTSFLLFALPGFAADGVAVIDMRTAVLSTQVAADAFKALEEDPDYSSNLEEAKSLQADRQSIAEKLQKELETLSQEQIAEMQKDIQVMGQDLEFLAGKIQQAQEETAQKIFTESGPAMQKIIGELIAAKQIKVIRQSKSSDKKCALGNETVPANPAASVTIVIALFAFPPIL